MIVLLLIIIFGWQLQSFAQEILSRSINKASLNAGAISAGISWFDFNNDGYLDLYVTNNGDLTDNKAQPNFLYKNNRAGSFVRIENDPAVSQINYASGVTCGDFNNDGWVDIFVTNQLNQNNELYTNNGDETFSRVTEGDVVNDYGDSYSAIWADFNNDGFLDLYVANHHHQNNFFYEGNRNGGFKARRDLVITNDSSSSYSASAADYDNDGDADLFVANKNNQNNLLFRNEGNLNFTKIEDSPVTSDGGNSNGGCWGDYNNDGYLDLLVTNGSFYFYKNVNFLYKNNGDGTFTKIVDQPVVQDTSYFMSGNWGDFDNDGDLDLYLTAYNHTDFFYINNGDETFTILTRGLLVSAVSYSTGAGAADYDNDGDLDLFTANWENQNNLFHTGNASDKTWFKVQCEGSESNLSGIGARIELTAEINGVETRQVREINGGHGFRSQDGLVAHFGLGKAGLIKNLTVKWPSGKVDRLYNLKPKRFVKITEGEGITREYELSKAESRRGESIVALLDTLIEESGIETAVEQAEELYKNQRNEYYFDVNEINNFGYQLVKSGNLETAVKIFELNNRLFPDITNTYDSLAEIYLDLSETEKARAILSEISSVIARDSTLTEMSRVYFKNRAKYILKHFLSE